MKFRLAVLVILFPLALAACYSTGDITPPPGYKSPTPELTQVPATETSAPTSEPPTPTVESTSAATELATPSGEASVTPSVPVVSVSGNVINSSGSSLTGGLTAILYLYNTATNQVDQTLTTPVKTDGAYQFTEVPVNAAITYLVSVVYEGITYFSGAVPYDATTVAYTVPVTVYDATDDLTVLTLEQFHLQFDFSIEGRVQIQALYVLVNPGSKSVIIPSDGDSIPFILIPDGAADVQYKLASGSAPLATAAGGFALLPGGENQYGIIALFSYPYTRSLKLTQPFILPVTATTVIVPEGVRVSSEQLTDAGIQASSGANYHLYQGSSLASGSSLSLAVSGKPGASTGFQFDQQTIVMIGVGVVGLLFIGLGIFLFLRDRARAQEEDEDTGEEDAENPDAPGDDPNSILDAIIALDDQYENGDIPKEAYKKRRADLKKRLKK